MASQPPICSILSVITFVACIHQSFAGDVEHVRDDDTQLANKKRYRIEEHIRWTHCLLQRLRRRRTSSPISFHFCGFNNNNNSCQHWADILLEFVDPMRPAYGSKWSSINHTQHFVFNWSFQHIFCLHSGHRRPCSSADDTNWTLHDFWNEISQRHRTRVRFFTSFSLVQP